MIDATQSTLLLQRLVVRWSSSAGPHKHDEHKLVSAIQVRDEFARWLRELPLEDLGEETMRVREDTL